MVFRTQIIDERVTQAGHGLVPGDVVRFDGVNYVKALSDTPIHSQVVGICSCVVGDVFDIVAAGMVEGLAGFIPGAFYYLSGTTPGALTTVSGPLIVPLFIADTANSGYFFPRLGEPPLSIFEDRIFLTGQPFDISVVDGDPVYYDQGSALWKQANTTTPEPTGVAYVTLGQVTLAGVRDGLTGLTGGVTYYLSTTSGLSTTPSEEATTIGVAQSPTELLVDIDLTGFKGEFIFLRNQTLSPSVSQWDPVYYDVPNAWWEVATLSTPMPQGVSVGNKIYMEGRVFGTSATLVPGTTYYLGATGGLTTDPAETRTRIGFAQASNVLIVNIHPIQLDDDVIAIEAIVADAGVLDKDPIYLSSGTWFKATNNTPKPTAVYDSALNRAILFGAFAPTSPETVGATLYLGELGGLTTDDRTRVKIGTQLNATRLLVDIDYPERDLLANSYHYVAGGFTTLSIASVMRYKELADVWAVSTAMPQAEFGGGSAGLSHDFGFVVGGNLLPASIVLTTNQRFSHIGFYWIFRAVLPVATYLQAVFSDQGAGTVWSVGGVTLLTTTTYRYAETTDTWTPGTPMPAGSDHQDGCSLGVGFGFAVGGTITGPAYRLTFSTSTWLTLPPLGYPATDPTVFPLDASYVFAVGGAFPVVSTVQRYDYVSNTWTVKSSLLDTLERGGASQLNEYGIVTWGINTTPPPPLNRNDRYNPFTDSWFTRAPILGAGRQYSKSFPV